MVAHRARPRRRSRPAPLVHPRLSRSRWRPPRLRRHRQKLDAPRHLRQNPRRPHRPHPHPPARLSPLPRPMLPPLRPGALQRRHVRAGRYRPRHLPPHRRPRPPHLDPARRLVGTLARRPLPFHCQLRRHARSPKPSSSSPSPSPSTPSIVFSPLRAGPGPSPSPLRGATPPSFVPMARCSPSPSAPPSSSADQNAGAPHACFAGLSSAAFSPSSPSSRGPSATHRTFHVFEPLAPRYAVDPGEDTDPGFQRWTQNHLRRLRLHLGNLLERRQRRHRHRAISPHAPSTPTGNTSKLAP